MKNIINSLIISFTAILLVSCGESGITPKSTRIAGPLGDYFEVVDKVYNVVNEDKIYIEFKRINDGLPDPWLAEYGKTVGWNDGQVEVNFSVDFYDKEGNVVGQSKTLKLSSDHFLDDQEKLQTLVDLATGESSSITFDLPSTKVSQFALASTFEYHPMPKKVILSVEEEEKYTKMIDEYERLIDRFMSIQKNENSFNMELYSEAQELSSEINDFINNTPPEMQDRFYELERKFSNAAMFGSH